MEVFEGQHRKEIRRNEKQGKNRKEIYRVVLEISRAHV